MGKRCSSSSAITPSVSRPSTTRPLDALRTTGWGNYSLFLADDGLLVGYLETEDFAAAVAGMEATDVNARWQAEMAEFFELPSGERPDTGLLRLEEVFHLA